jgi:hypothetical protein
MTHKIEKLELMHLAGYLPYGLKVLVDISSFPKAHWLRQISKTAIEPLVGVKYDKFYVGGDKIDVDNYYEFKPILRPLSDLTKEIEHEGESFIPKDSLHIDYAFDYFDENVHSISLIEGFGFDVELFPYGLVQKLYEWHFNVHDLPADLWVDINTVKV